jgi:hypothetical protein
MRLWFISSLALFLGLSMVPSEAAQKCPSFTLSAKAQPSTRRSVLAGKGFAKISVRLRSNDVVDDINFKMVLPVGLSLIRTATRPLPKLVTPPRVVQNLDGSTAVYWLRMNLVLKKRSQPCLQSQSHSRRLSC